MAVSITSALSAETGRIGPEIIKRSLGTSAWANLTPQEKWPDGMGASITQLYIERASRSANAVTWENVIVAAGGDYETSTPGAEAPSVITVNTANSTATYNLQACAIESAKINLDSIRLSFQFSEQLGAIYDRYLEQVADIWSNIRRDDYVAKAANQQVLDASLTTGSSMSTAGPAIYLLTQGVLDDWYSQLALAGVGDHTMSGQDGFALRLVCDRLVSRDLLRRNPELREDLRHADPMALQKSLGVSQRTYGGFVHTVDPHAPRYNWNAGTGAWDRVYPFTASGNAWIVNSAYKTATHTDSIIHVPAVYSELVPSLIPSPGGSTKFGEQGYRGEFDFLNYRTDTNKDLSWGFFRGLIKRGCKPKRTEFGVVIRHRLPTAADDLVLA